MLTAIINSKLTLDALEEVCDVFEYNFSGSN